MILSASLQPTTVCVCTTVVLWLLMQKGSVLQRCPLHICCSSRQWHMLTVLAWAVGKRLSVQICIFPPNNIGWLQLQLDFFCSGRRVLKSASGTYVSIKILKMLLTFSGTGSLELALPLDTCWTMVSMQSTEPIGSSQAGLRAGLKPMGVVMELRPFFLCSPHFEKICEVRALILWLYHRIDPFFAFISLLCGVPIEHCCFGSGAAEKNN